MGHESSVVVFDVNETLSDMTPIARRFAEIGAPEHLATVWFSSVLRDGFALTAAGSGQRFAAIADGVLRTVLTGVALDRGTDAAVEHVLSGFMELPVHDDVPDGVRALHTAGLRLVTLTNGSTEVADGLLSRAGLRGEFERLLSVDDAGVWKPARGAYEYAARVCGTDPARMVLVAVHPWDIDGAARAGMATAWIDRHARPYPAHFTPPDYTAASLGELSTKLRG